MTIEPERTDHGCDLQLISQEGQSWFNNDFPKQQSQLRQNKAFCIPDEFRILGNFAERCLTGELVGLD